MSQNREVRQTIVQLLSNMSDGKEIRSYLQRFSEVGRSKFAVIKIGGAILSEELEGVASALAFLQTVGLTPVVIHGGGPQLDAALAEAGAVSEKIGGVRVTTPEVLAVAREVFGRENLKLVEAIRAQGVQAHSLHGAAIDATYKDKAVYGLVGEATGVRADVIISVIESGAAPVISCLGVTQDGQLVNVNADAAVAALVHALQPLKIIFLTGTGGLLDDAGALIQTINLTTDYEGLMSAPWVHSGMRLKLQEIKRLLDALPLTSSVAITSPGQLIKELFTHGGAGTLLRRGENILTVKDRRDIAPAKLEQLVERAFGRRLVNGWFEGLDFAAAHVTESYRAAAVVTRIAGAAYLDKFAVLDDARGEGLARGVWKRLVAETPEFIWRSRTENPVNEFYFDVADGSVRRGRWTIFWKGLDDFTRLTPLVDKVAALPPAFED